MTPAQVNHLLNIHIEINNPDDSQSGKSQSLKATPLTAEDIEMFKRMPLAATN